MNVQPRNIEQDCLSCWMNSCFNPQLEEGCSMISRTSLPKQARTRNAQASVAANLWAFAITTKSRHTIVVLCFHYRLKPPRITQWALFHSISSGKYWEITWNNIPEHSRTILNCSRLENSKNKTNYQKLGNFRSMNQTLIL